MIEVRNNRDDSHIYDYKGKLFFNVDDPLDIHITKLK